MPPAIFVGWFSKIPNLQKIGTVPCVVSGTVWKGATPKILLKVFPTTPVFLLHDLGGSILTKLFGLTTLVRLWVGLATAGILSLGLVNCGQQAPVGVQCPGTWVWDGQVEWCSVPTFPPLPVVYPTPLTYPEFVERCKMVSADLWDSRCDTAVAFIVRDYDRNQCRVYAYIDLTYDPITRKHEEHHCEGYSHK
jgi:hypothetical protein